MKIAADLHIHTAASGHAYSTVSEVAFAAAEKGLKIIAITDHGPKMPGGPHLYHFTNMRILPDYIYGVRVLKGVEANISNEGKIDMEERHLKLFDLVAAGIHENAGYDNKTIEEHTAATIEAIKNPLVKMITHPDSLYFPVDLSQVVQAAAEHNVVLELNASSFDKYRCGRRGSIERAVEMCKLAKKYKVKLCLNSDAHFSADVGNIENLAVIIEMAGLKDEDVINTSISSVRSFLSGG